MIWILNNTHSSRKIGSVTIMRICWSFSRSKPSLTIAPKFGKTIEKPSISMVYLQKNIQWWWSRDGKTVEKPSMAMVPWKKNITIPLLWKNDHRRSLIWNNTVSPQNVPKVSWFKMSVFCNTYIGIAINDDGFFLIIGDNLPLEDCSFSVGIHWSSRCIQLKSALDR